MSLWPGLCQLWVGGHWSGLVVAMLFTGFVNLGIVTTFLWPEWFPSTVPVVSWVLAGGMIAVSVWRTFSPKAESISPATDSQEDLLPRAQVEYLQGHWFEAESLVKQLLESNPQDVEARLMLAATCRHTRRVDEARQQLALLQTSDGGDKWAWEIDCEKELLDRLDQRADNGAEPIHKRDASMSEAA